MEIKERKKKERKKTDSDFHIATKLHKPYSLNKTFYQVQPLRYA